MTSTTTLKKKLTRGRWSKDDFVLPKKLYHSRIIWEIAKQVRRSLATVSHKALKMGLKKKRVLRRSKDETELFKELCGIGKTESIAELLGRSAQLIRQKAHRMGISKRNFKKPLRTICSASGIFVERSELRK